MKSKMKWNCELDRFMAQLAAEGNSSREIAQALSTQKGVGVTRDAVIGRCFRQKIPLAGQTGRKPGPAKPRTVKKNPKPAKPPETGRVLTSFRLWFPNSKAPQPSQRMVSNEMVLPEGHHLTLAVKQILKKEPASKALLLRDIAPGQCKWGTNTNAANQHLMCGHPVVPGHQYCPHHVLRGLDLPTVRNRTLKQAVSAAIKQEESHEIIRTVSSRDRSRAPA